MENNVFEMLRVTLDTDKENIKKQLENKIKSCNNQQKYIDAKPYQDLLDNIDKNGFLENQKNEFANLRNQHIEGVKKYATFYMLIPGVICTSSLMRLLNNFILCKRNNNNEKIKGIEDIVEQKKLLKSILGIEIETIENYQKNERELPSENLFNQIVEYLKEWNYLVDIKKVGPKYLRYYDNEKIIAWYKDFETVKVEETGSKESHTCCDNLKKKFEQCFIKNNIIDHEAINKYLRYIKCLDFISLLKERRTMGFITPEQKKMLEDKIGNQDKSLLEEYLKELKIDEKTYDEFLEEILHIDSITSVMQNNGVKVEWSVTTNNNHPFHVEYLVVRKKDGKDDVRFDKITKSSMVDQKPLNSGCPYTYAVRVRLGNFESKDLKKTSEPFFICSPVNEEDISIVLTVNSFVFSPRGNALPRGVGRITVERKMRDGSWKYVGDLKDNTSIKDEGLKDGEKYTYRLIAIYIVNHKEMNSKSKEMEKTFFAPPTPINCEIHQNGNRVVFSCHQVPKGSSVQFYRIENMSFGRKKGESLSKNYGDRFSKVVATHYDVPSDFLGFMSFLPVTCKNGIYVAGEEKTFAFQSLPQDIKIDSCRNMSKPEIEVSWEWKANWDKVSICNGEETITINRSEKEVKTIEPPKNKVTSCDITVIVGLKLGNLSMVSLPLKKTIYLEDAKIEWKVKRLFLKRTQYDLEILLTQPLLSNIELCVREGSIPYEGSYGEVIKTFAPEDIKALELTTFHFEYKRKTSKGKLYFHLKLKNANAQKVDVRPLYCEI